MVQYKGGSLQRLKMFQYKVEGLFDGKRWCNTKWSGPLLVQDVALLVDYRIRPNYRTYPYKRTVKQLGSFSDYCQRTFCILLYRDICCSQSS